MIQKIENRLFKDGKELFEMFPIKEWDDPYAYRMAGIRGFDPMLAMEIPQEDKELYFNSENFIVEEKFDGTRALVYFLAQGDCGFARVFSRRISTKTGFYCENSDRLPHIRDVDLPTMQGTILDGELFIDGQAFREVSSTLNCSWDKAIERQLELGFITFHAFDILYYKGVNIRNMKLIDRKTYLKKAVEEINNKYIVEVPHYKCGDNKFSVEEYYNSIVGNGGEGVIIKPLNARYETKRSHGYLKLKKKFTRELVIMGFREPTRLYEGKDVLTWSYWEKQDVKFQGNFYGQPYFEPVTKHYFNKQVGNLVLGVFIDKGDYDKLNQKNQGEIKIVDDKILMSVCECSGFDDNLREYFTRNRKKMENKVVEVECNDIMLGSRRLRHPRFLRMREDKNRGECTWDSLK